MNEHDNLKYLLTVQKLNKSEIIYMTYLKLILSSLKHNASNDYSGTLAQDVGQAASQIY